MSMEPGTSDELASCPYLRLPQETKAMKESGGKSAMRVGNPDADVAHIFDAAGVFEDLGRSPATDLGLGESWHCVEKNRRTEVRRPIGLQSDGGDPDVPRELRGP